MRYEVKALRGEEDLTALQLDAADANDAASQALAQGYKVISIRAKAAWPVGFKPRRGHFPLVLFSQELLALLQAGLALVEALETLTEKEQRPEVKQTLTQIIASLYEGHAFSHALQHSPANFPALYVATVRASERTGDLHFHADDFLYGVLCAGRKAGPPRPSPCRGGCAAGRPGDN